MNSKARVLAAIERRVPDRVPIDYLGLPEIDERLKAHFGVQSDEDLRRALHVDLRSVGPKYVGPELRQFPDGSKEDVWGTRWARVVVNDSGGYREVAWRPLAEVTTVAEAQAHRWPDPDWWDYSGIEAACDEHAEYATWSGWFDLINGAGFMRGMQEVVLDLATDSPVGDYIFDRLTEFYHEYSRRIFAAANGKLDIAWFGDDYGTQRGLLMSVPMWKRKAAPHLQKMIDLAKGFDLKVMLHSCGSIRRVIPYLIDMGVDVLDTLQPEAAEMDPRDLKREFGHRVAFHGAISTAGLLVSGTPEQVREEIKERIAVYGQGGGYIVAPTHNIQFNTPTENVLAMYEAAWKYGRYTLPGANAG